MTYDLDKLDREFASARVGSIAARQHYAAMVAANYTAMAADLKAMRKALVRLLTQASYGEQQYRMADLACRTLDGLNWKDRRKIEYASVD